jgi:hypothetical protein
MEKEFRLLKKRVVIDSFMPSELPRTVLDAMRQWYLFQEIWPLCYDNNDITCHKPIEPKPEMTVVLGHTKYRNGKNSLFDDT